MLIRLFSKKNDSLKHVRNGIKGLDEVETFHENRMYGNSVNSTVLWKALLLEVEEQEDDLLPQS
jgi:hypothetical protein